MTRWMLDLQEFDFAIQNTPSQANVVKDFLSRLDKNEPTMEVFNKLLDASLFSMTHHDENN